MVSEDHTAKVTHPRVDRIPREVVVPDGSCVYPTSVRGLASVVVSSPDMRLMPVLVYW